MPAVATAAGELGQMPPFEKRANRPPPGSEGASGYACAPPSAQGFVYPKRTRRCRTAAATVSREPRRKNHARGLSGVQRNEVLPTAGNWRTPTCRQIESFLQLIP